MRLRRGSLVCQEAVELVTAYMDGTLSRTDRRRFERHLADCPHCTEYLAQMGATVRLTGRLESDGLPAEVRDGFSDLYQRWRTESS
jgi:anti-sigma factor RsiW